MFATGIVDYEGRAQTNAARMAQLVPLICVKRSIVVGEMINCEGENVRGRSRRFLSQAPQIGSQIKRVWSRPALSAPGS
jgi:hypothetical protein